MCIRDSPRCSQVRRWVHRCRGRVWASGHTADPDRQSTDSDTRKESSVLRGGLNVKPVQAYARSACTPSLPLRPSHRQWEFLRSWGVPCPCRTATKTPFFPAGTVKTPAAKRPEADASERRFSAICALPHKMCIRDRLYAPPGCPV